MSLDITIVHGKLFVLEQHLMFSVSTALQQIIQEIAAILNIELTGLKTLITMELVQGHSMTLRLLNK